MPGRYTLGLILAFFLGMLGWQWLRNYGGSLGDGPQLKPSLELAAQDGTTNWTINYNKKRLGDAITKVVKTPMGVYVLSQDVILDGDLESFMGPIGVFAKVSGIKLNDFRAIVRTEMELTYTGTMRKMLLNFTARPRPVVVLPGSKEERRTPEEKKPEKDDGNNLLRLYLEGIVSQLDQTLTFKGYFALAGMKVPVEDVKVKYRAENSIFSNISPTDCLAGIRLGQRWQTPIIDPTQLMTAALYNSKAKELSNVFNADEMMKTKITEVQVLPELKEMDWNNAKVACFVVQSNEKGSKMQMWVNASNYRVLRQAFESDLHTLEMVREPKKED